MDNRSVVCADNNSAVCTQDNLSNVGGGGGRAVGTKAPKTNPNENSQELILFFFADGIKKYHEIFKSILKNNKVNK